MFLYWLYSSHKAARKNGSSSSVAASHSCLATLSSSSQPSTVLLILSSSFPEISIAGEAPLDSLLPSCPTPGIPELAGIWEEGSEELPIELAEPKA